MKADLLPSNPTALRICIYLAANHVGTNERLGQILNIGRSACNKSLAALKAAGVVFIDEYVNPRQFVLTAKAYGDESRLPAATLLDCYGSSKPPTETETIIQNWIATLAGRPEARERYQQFIMQQLENVHVGDITLASFLALFAEHEDFR